MATHMNDDSPIAVVFNGEPLPAKHKATWVDWLRYYLFNLYRKPMVWKRQKELLKIYTDMKEALAVELYPTITRYAQMGCPDCKDAYAALKPQVFLSQIELILRRMGCDFHPEIFNAFITKHGDKFKHSEEIARWINGFS